MRFAITRTSIYDDELQPCAEAERGQTDYWDCRTFKSPEEHDAKLGEKWHDRGTDHQIVRGPRGGAVGIKRKLEPRTAWFVEVGSLEDLVALHEKYGDLILTTALGDDSVPCIEIYDGWRE